MLLGFLRRSGLSVQAVDAQRSRLEPEALVELILKTRPRIVYWNLRGRSDFLAAQSMIPSVKQTSRPALMIAGGDFATQHDLAILDRISDLDGIVRGEPELSLEALAQRVLEGEEWRDEPGISARADRILRNPPRRLMEDLDVLPAAPDDLFDTGRLERGQRVLFSRGCNSDCSYCGLQTPYRTEHVHRSRFWRCRSSTAIVDEIEHYHRHKNVVHFVFNSFVFFGYEAEAEQVKDVACEILRRRLAITFSFVTHPGHLCRNRSLVPLLKDAGLKRIMLGVDTGLPRALELYGLEFSRTDTVTALRILHEHAIDFVPAFIFYDPFLTIEEIYLNLEFIESIEPFFSHLSTPFGKILDQHIVNSALHVRADTPLYSHLLEQGLADHVDPLQADPVVRFKSPAVGKVYKVHRLTNKATRERIWSALDSPETAERFPQVNRLPLEILREILSTVERQPHLDEATMASLISDWLQERIG